MTTDVTTTSTTYVGTASALPTKFALYDPNVGKYAFIANTEYETAEYTFPTPATLFSVNGSGVLYDAFGRVGLTGTNPNDVSSPVFFEDSGTAIPSSDLITCTVVRNADGTCSLPCSSHDGAWTVESIQQQSGNPNVWNIGSSNNVGGVFVPQVFG